MADPLLPQQTRSPDFWVHLCRWLWRGFSFFWITIVLGLGINIVSTRLTSQSDFPADTPVGWVVGWVLGHLLLTSLLGAGLLLLTALTGFISHRTPAHTPPSTSRLQTQQHTAIVRMLQQEYDKQAQSLQGATMMALGLHERTDVIRSSTQLVFRRTNITPASALPPGTSIAQVYDGVGRGLLILGAPGTGKTTLLLDLARELLTRAEGEPTHPIAVILNLSSWASKSAPLGVWVIEQLRLVYGIPSRLGQTLLEQDHLLLLLDGLDEVKTSARSDCIEAINLYREEHFVPLVVCSRSHEYVTQRARLALSSAVEIQPLQEQEVMAYLKHIGKPMDAVRAALRTNPSLKRLLTTPLMLSVVILTYRDKAAKDLPQLGSAKEQQHQIFRHYVDRMLESQAIKSTFTPQQTHLGLIWLAQQMKQQHLTEFYLERLQPSWLPTEQAQTHYRVLLRLLLRLLVVLTLGLVGGLLFGLNGALIGGLLGLPGNVDREIHRMQSQETLTWSSKRAWPWLVGGLLLGLLSGLYYGWLSGLYYGLLLGLAGGLLFGLKGKQLEDNIRIHPNQGIQNAGRNGLRVGLLFWGLIGLLVGLLVGPLAGLFAGLFAGLLAGLSFGGGTYLQHYILRYLLWRDGIIPCRYVLFLEDACDRILLQRVGGGYRFIHPLFQEYFASQGTGTSSSAQSQSSPPQP